jgi:hypothetical protein
VGRGSGVEVAAGVGVVVGASVAVLTAVNSTVAVGEPVIHLITVGLVRGVTAVASAIVRLSAHAICSSRIKINRTIDLCLIWQPILN